MKLLFASFFLLILPLVAAACAQPWVEDVLTPETPPADTRASASDDPAGIVIRKATVVEHGPDIDSLEELLDEIPFYEGDALRVTQGGEALMDFGDRLWLRLFNDTELNVVSAKAEQGTSWDVQAFLEAGGVTGELTEAGGQVVIEVPGGPRITILGTTFFVVYDPATGVTTVGNFHGHVEVTDGGRSITLSPGYYVTLPSGSPLPLAIGLTAFEARARVQQSPVIAASLLASTASSTNVATATRRPTTAPSIPPTKTPTPGIVAEPMLIQPPTPDTTAPSVTSTDVWPNPAHYGEWCDSGGYDTSVTFNAAVSDPSGISNVEIGYLYQVGDSPGPWKSIEASPNGGGIYSVTIKNNDGNQAYDILGGSDGWIYWYVRATDLAENTIDINGPALWIEYCLPPPDQTGPSIINVFASPDPTYYEGGNCGDTWVTLNVTVSDPSGIEQVQIWYSYESNANSGGWQLAAVTDLGAGNYSASFNNNADNQANNTLAGNDGRILWYVYATDTAGNSTDSGDQFLTIKYCIIG